MLNREVKKNPALMAMLNTEKEEKTEKVEKVTSPKKQKRSARERNPQGYERYRGRNNCKPMSYYIPDDLLKLLAIKSATEGKTKSELVIEGLKYVLREEIKADKQKKSSSTTANENIEKEAI